MTSFMHDPLSILYFLAFVLKWDWLFVEILWKTNRDDLFDCNKGSLKTNMVKNMLNVLQNAKIGFQSVLNFFDLLGFDIFHLTSEFFPYLFSNVLISFWRMNKKVHISHINSIIKLLTLFALAGANPIMKVCLKKTQFFLNLPTVQFYNFLIFIY